MKTFPAKIASTCDTISTVQSMSKGWLLRDDYVREHVSKCQENEIDSDWLDEITDTQVQFAIQMSSMNSINIEDTIGKLEVWMRGRDYSQSTPVEELESPFDVLVLSVISELKSFCNR